MLDENMRLLSSLPSRNSPSLPRDSQAAAVVLVQYLFALALAVAEAEGKRVRIKWPDDLYAVTRDREKKKIGGTLVNTSFESWKVVLVVGCSTRASMERTLAAIMASFERMWAEFAHERGSFEPFMDWLQWCVSLWSPPLDQLVTLTIVTPARKVSIVRITPDHGLLRTLSKPDGCTGSYGSEFIDLQSDGNSFDLKAGLIKTKTLRIFLQHAPFDVEFVPPNDFYTRQSELSGISDNPQRGNELP
ncbi:hypothetical protein C8T65DRAFT_699025 [Cerioporus squamosus]|nr:hypothetical protein C8T65DRAFT_699025 [Cerioporus squamosus]